MTASRGNSPAPEPPGADDAGAQLLARVELGLAQLLRRAERTSAPTRGLTDGLDRSGYLLLQALVAGGAQHVRVLAERLGVDASTTTRQVAALDRAGHVRRSRDPHDGRAVVVEVTESGRSALADQRRHRGDLYGAVLRDWSAADRRHLADLVERLNADLDEHKRTT